MKLHVQRWTTTWNKSLIWLTLTEDVYLSHREKNKLIFIEQSFIGSKDIERIKASSSLFELWVLTALGAEPTESQFSPRPVKCEQLEIGLWDLTAFVLRNLLLWPVDVYEMKESEEGRIRHSQLEQVMCLQSICINPISTHLDSLYPFIASSWCYSWLGEVVNIKFYHEYPDTDVTCCFCSTCTH